MKNPFKRKFTCLFSSGDTSDVTGYVVPVFGVPAYVEGGSIRNLRRLKRLTRRATRAAERLSEALIELDSVNRAQFRHIEALSKKKETPAPSVGDQAAN